MTDSTSFHEWIEPDISRRRTRASGDRCLFRSVSTVLIRRWFGHILLATVLTPGVDPDEIDRTTHARYDWKHRRPPARPNGMAGQSTRSRANHQAQERKAPQALPCPPRHEVYNADPFLFALHVESLCGGRKKCHGLLVTARHCKHAFA